MYKKIYTGGERMSRLLSKIIERDYIFIASPPEKKMLKKIMNPNFRKKVFLVKDDKYYSLSFSETNNLEFIYKQCVVLDESLSLNDIIVNLKNNDYVLFKNNHEFLGYSTYDSFMNNLIKEYEQLESYTNTILNTIEGSCIIINSKQEIIQWTKQAEKIFSLSKEETIGKPITQFFSEDRLEILNTLDGKSVHQLQHHAREDLIVLINSNPVYYNDKIIGAVVYETDITSQIRLSNKLYDTSNKLFNLEKEVIKAHPSNNPFSSVKGNSQAIKKTIEMVKKVALTDASVLIYGESGVGKELFAKAIHDLREQGKAPFVAINCGAIPNSLFESEIFGYEKGAFSGADQRGKKGKVELANGGTLFLDEMGEMPLEMQVKFLRILQEKRFYPIGGTKEIEVDFRIVAATNRDLKQLINQGKFREDLYYRLNVVNFLIPPLRERHEDIIELTHYFLYEISIKYNRPIHGIPQEIMNALMSYSWPGNIRELKNTIERLVVFSENGELKLEDLPFEAPSKPKKSFETTQMKLNERLQEYEKEVLLSELKKANGNKIACAKKLGITRATLYNRINKLGISNKI